MPHASKIRPQIVAAARCVDNEGDLGAVLALEERIRALGIPLHELIIEPLRADWHAEEKTDHFRSGCAPIEALERARDLIRDGTEAVVIRGEDPLRTGYSRAERLSRMAIYGPEYPLTRAYTDLARAFIEKHRSDEEEFRALCERLFDNHLRSFHKAKGVARPPLIDERWKRPVTELFRGIDCANPLLDFSGRVLLTSPQLADRLDIPARDRLELAAVATHRLPGDGKPWIGEIADYRHLRDCYLRCNREAGIDFGERFLAGDALLEVYTCYPVVPMGFLIATGMVDALSELPGFLEQHSVTVTGGMNLARAPWNNPALNGLIALHHRLLGGPEHWGLVHGNGGLGYRQGIALVCRISE